MEANIKSVLNLDLIQFENIEFVRIGRKNDYPVTFGFKIDISKKDNEDIFKVTLTCEGKKENEYTIKIVLTGIFSFEERTELEEETKKILLSQNAIAIIMPYLRSELSILTAQPNVDCLVLPPLNISEMMD